MNNNNTIIIYYPEDYKNKILTEQFHDIWNRAVAQYEEISEQVKYWISGFEQKSTWSE